MLSPSSIVGFSLEWTRGHDGLEKLRKYFIGRFAIFCGLICGGGLDGSGDFFGFLLGNPLKKMPIIMHISVFKRGGRR